MNKEHNNSGVVKLDSINDCSKQAFSEDLIPEHDDNSDGTTDKELLYSIDDVPPWYICIPLGFQHYLTMFGSTLSVPLVLAPFICATEDHVGVSQIVSTVFFVSGLCTLLQTTIGSRLPIIQGATFAFLSPSIALMSLPRWKCPVISVIDNTTSYLSPLNGSVETGIVEHRQIWHERVCELQGAIMVASIFQVVIGFSGIMGLVLRFIGPLTVTPTVALIGLSLFQAAVDKAGKHWWIACMTIFLTTLFSQYMRNISIPTCSRKINGKPLKAKSGFPLFKLFPVILAMVLSWLVCFILTVTNVLPTDHSKWGYEARTDNRTFVITEAAWFRIPYPCQWGIPTVSAAGVFGMLAGVLASMMESVGDYYACARLSGAPPPPYHAVNRGIGVEGIGCIIAGLFGTGNGTTSYSENVGAIGITKVGSRRVVQCGAVIMILLGCLGKFGALFVTIPEPVIGGMFIVMFGMITAVGFSNLQFVDLNSTRNLFVLGFSIFIGLSLPQWLMKNENSIDTGSELANQIVGVLLSTSMFVGGLTGFVLDNTIPGTDAERGLNKWRVLVSGKLDSFEGSIKYKPYDFPYVQRYVDRWKWTRYVPFCPGFGAAKRYTRRNNKNNSHC